MSSKKKPRTIYPHKIVFNRNPPKPEKVPQKSGPDPLIQRKDGWYRIVKWGPEHGNAHVWLMHWFKNGKDFTAEQAAAHDVTREVLDDLVGFELLNYYRHQDVYSTQVVCKRNHDLKIEVPVDGWDREEPEWFREIRERRVVVASTPLSDR